jgi:hypothetical protein
MTLQYFQRRAFSQGVSDSYATVRRTGSSNLRWKDRLRFRLRPRLAAIRERWRLGGQRRSPEPSLLDIKLAVLDAWREGVRFHGSALKSDPDLLSWVLKSHYLS